MSVLAEFDGSALAPEIDKNVSSDQWAFLCQLLRTGKT